MRSGRRIGVLRHRDFRLLFIGQSVSQIGSQAVTVAMALYITRRTGSPTDLSIILAAGAAPLVVLVVFGGVIADRLRRDRMIIVSDTTRMVLHGLLGTLIILGAPPIWLIAVIEVLFGVATAVFEPAYMGLVPQTVPEDEIQQAQALQGAVFNLSFVLGPVVATVLVLTIGAGETFLVDGASFLVGSVLLIPVEPRVRGARQRAAEADFLAELKAGFGELRSRPWIWGTTIAYALVLSLALVPWMAVGPIGFRDVYGNVAYYGVAVTVSGVGAVLASVLALRWHPRHPLRMCLCCGVLWAAAPIGVAVGLPLPLLYLVAIISGASGSLTGVWWLTTLSHHVPPDALSRVSAWDYMGSSGLMPFAFIAAGPIAAAVGPRLVLGVGGGLGALCAALALLAPGAWALPARPVGTTQPAPSALPRI